VLQEGDKLAIDVSLFMNGYHGDNCATVIVGHANSAEDTNDSANIAMKKKLIRANVEALDASIAVCKPGHCITDIGSAIQTVADKYKFETIREFCGHGLGKNLHMTPLILHYPHTEKHPLLPGMIFTIEPIFCENSSRIAVCSEDNWSAFTLDGGGSAQFEHEVLITEDGAEVLTVPP
jgi:methionyl aminopeptidase